MTVFQKKILSDVAKIVDAAKRGVDYSRRKGALCPECDKKAVTYKTTPWKDGIRIRYHRCENQGCLVCAVGVSFKSLEVDQ